MKILIYMSMFCALSAAVGSEFSERWAKAAKLANEKKYDAAIKAFAALGAESEFRDENYKCLRKAAIIANSSKSLDAALALAKMIRNKPLSKLCQMELLVKNKKYRRLLDEFASEDILRWPENCVGQGYYYRGMAYRNSKMYSKAVEDLKMACAYFPNKSAMSLYLMSLGNIYHKDLKDDANALKTFRKLALNGLKYAWTTRVGIANTTALLIKQKRFAEALAFLSTFDINEKNGSYWSGTILLARADVLAASGESDKAVALYAKIAATPGMPKPIARSCERRMAKIRDSREKAATSAEKAVEHKQKVEK